MRNRVIALLVFLAASMCFAGGYGPPVISSEFGGCGSSSWSHIGYTRLISNPLFQNNLVNVDPLPPLNGSFGYVGDSPNYLKTFILSLMPEDATFPVDPSTGTASGATTFNVFGRPTQIQVTVDQNQRLISVSFVDPFDGTQQKATGSYASTGTIRTFGGNPQALAGDPFATGSG